jgi:hypothetical protein
MVRQELASRRKKRKKKKSKISKKKKVLGEKRWMYWIVVEPAAAEADRYCLVRWKLQRGW